MTTDRPKSDIPAAAPLRGYQRLQTEIDAAIAEVLDSGWYVLCEACTRFEASFSSYLGVEGAVGTASGTDALEVALRALGVGPGDEVLVPGLTASATATAVVRAGARPVIVDVDPVSFTMDPEHAAAAVSGITKAMIPVHLYGHPARLPELTPIADRDGLVVVEDCAQSHGATIEDRHTGSFGDAAAFSFYPTKNLPALGDGGCVTSSEPSVLQRAQVVRQYGWEERQISSEAGLNSRLDDLQAGVLDVRLRHLNADNQRRRRLAALYSAGLVDTALSLPSDSPGHVYHQYAVLHGERDSLRKSLSDSGVGSGVLYPRPLHTQPAFASFRCVPEGLPVSSRVSEGVLCLPIYPELSEDEVQRVIPVLRKNL